MNRRYWCHAKVSTRASASRRVNHQSPSSRSRIDRRRPCRTRPRDALGIRLRGALGTLAMGITDLIGPFLAEVRRILRPPPSSRVHHSSPRSASPRSRSTRSSSRSAPHRSRSSCLSSLFGTRYAPNAGRIALPLIYIAVVAALLGRGSRKWRYFHLILYLALLLGLLHGVRLLRLVLRQPLPQRPLPRARRRDHRRLRREALAAPGRARPAPRTG